MRMDIDPPSAMRASMRWLAFGLWLTVQPSGWAQDAVESGAWSRTMVIIIVALGASLVGIILYWFSQQSSRSKYEQDRPRGLAAHAPSGDATALVPNIMEQVSQLPGSSSQHQQVAQAVSSMVSSLLEEKVGSVKREMIGRYEQVLEEQRRTEAVLQRKFQETLGEKKQTTAILESLAEGLVVVNTKGEVMMMNPAAERLLAVTQKNQIGHPLQASLKPGQLLSMAQGSPKDKNREIVLSAKDDETKVVLRASNAMITDENGATVGMVAVLSDITQQRKLDELKTEFLSKVSHELRTPLLAMRHALLLVTDQVAGPLTDDQTKSLEIAQRNLEQLTGFINDLLDLSKLESKKMEVRREPTDVGAVIEAVRSSMSAWSLSKALTLNVELEGGLPQVACDPTRIQQVLTNLVGNAIKFTPKQGQVTIGAKFQVSPPALVVRVSDTGVGIAKDDLPKLFQKFQQVGERTHTDIQGTGLGLAIAKEIIELHHGRIWAESDGKQGAAFCFLLPIESAQATPV